MFPQHDNEEYDRYPDPPHGTSGFGSMTMTTCGPVDLSLTADVYSMSTAFEPSLYADASHYIFNGNVSPSVYAEENEMRLPSSSLSTASASSSAMGSPRSNSGPSGVAGEWQAHSQGAAAPPNIVGNDYVAGAEFGYSSLEDISFDLAQAKGFVDPSLINPEITGSSLGIAGYDSHYTHHQHHQSSKQEHPASPSNSTSSPHIKMLRTDSSSPSFVHNGSYNLHHHQASFPNSPFPAPVDTNAQRPSMSSFVSPTSTEYLSSDETKEKQRCTYPDCRKLFKDLKAHMLTHQNERPEKCPIQSCEYHTKGFARKYDKNRHTLTHYKGDMVCSFCPGLGSPGEKCFNRADTFKRHLVSVHGVEQTPPNSRKKTPTGVNNGKKLNGYAPDATGKCSTCSQTFSNAQDFYEHLDDCVLRMVQQGDPAEAINAQLLNEVEGDEDVRETLKAHQLEQESEHKTDDDHANSESDGDPAPKAGNHPGKRNKKSNPPNGVQKSRGMTQSRGGVLSSRAKGRKNRDFPDSWGYPENKKSFKKRVLCVFDGPRRLNKDDLMLGAGQEVRVKLADGKSYVTDLDILSLARADGFLNATDQEKGPWISDDPTDAQLAEMRALLSTA